MFRRIVERARAVCFLLRAALGVAVVNIDNGFGAACVALRIVGAET
ncbi:MAG: hypothetical protein GY769_19195 [bacterium]|nr:hypothetical protein [bacterium]